LYSAKIVRGIAPNAEARNLVLDQQLKDANAISVLHGIIMQ